MRRILNEEALILSNDRASLARDIETSKGSTGKAKRKAAKRIRNQRRSIARRKGR